MSLRDEISLLLFGVLLLAVYGAESILLLSYAYLRLRRGSWKNIRLTRFDVPLHVLAAVGIVCLLYGYFIEPYRIDVTETTIRTTKLKSTSFRIVHISDLHCDNTPRNEERAVKIIQQLKPDIIVATGDFLNRASALPRLQATLRQLDAPLGEFAVKGNFEIGCWTRLDLFKDTGFRVLDRDTVVVTKQEDAIAVSGLSFGLADAYRDVLQEPVDGRFHIFLFHTPDLIEDVRGLGVDLYLCGHTHGGQVALPLYGALITFSKFGKRYEAGRYEFDGTTLYVNRGLGLEPAPAPQVRFLARPEIAVFDIVPE
jgi:hypothetical protein